ncbi:McrC family protein [Trichococcus shcherbakoviae]|uniref:McrC family protein n=1 Tax=Trichococcus shcherbakoviae TaxID=2094020 RepID=UPI0029F58CA9|nr:McrC family protein [Trichococcus shcherbakoviae]
MKNRVVTITEYGRLYAGADYEGVKVTKKDIEELKTFIDEGNTVNDDGADSSLDNFLRPIRLGVQANNYVGVLQTKSGLTIEILPKIHGKNESSKKDNDVRKLFLKMLGAVKNIDGRTFSMAHLDTANTNLFEVFIRMFLGEVDSIIKQGLKSAYIGVEENEAFLKGKLLMKQQIQHNLVNKARFYNHHDEFMINCPENRLIRTALEYLLHISSDFNNQRLIREQLIYFNQVTILHNVDQGFQRIKLGRNFQYYTQALQWCEIILAKQSFTSFKGSSMAFALLFPMDKIFEAYVSDLVSKKLSDYNVSLQDRKNWLFDEHGKQSSSYRLRPDIVIRSDETTVIADTKWKVLKADGPAQADLYQMYAYHTRYSHKGENVQKVVLIYPYSKEFLPTEFHSLTDIPDTNGVQVDVRYLDLYGDVDGQIKRMLIGQFTS